MTFWRCYRFELNHSLDCLIYSESNTVSSRSKNIPGSPDLSPRYSVTKSMCYSYSTQAALKVMGPAAHSSFKWQRKGDIQGIKHDRACCYQKTVKGRMPGCCYYSRANDIPRNIPMITNNSFFLAIYTRQVQKVPTLYIFKNK